MNDFPDNNDPFGDRADDRLGLDAFDRVPVPDQWNEIVARSGEIETTATDSRRTGQWAMAAAVMALVAGGAVALVLRNSDDSTVQAPTTVDEVPLPTVASVPSSVTTVPGTVPGSLDPTESSVMPTTTVETTVSAPTTVPAVVAPATPAWSVACTEVAGDADVTYRFDGRLAEFTTLGAVPALDLELPVVNTTAGPLDPLVGVQQIPGGVLVLVQPPGDWPAGTENADTMSLVAVNTDGSIRWRRCIDDASFGSLLVVPPELAPAVAWVSIRDYDVVETDLELRGYDLATGADQAASFDGAGQTVRASTDRYAVIGKDWSGLVLEPTDRIQVFDVLDGSVDERPYPPDASTRLDELQLGAVTSASGDLVLVDYFPLSQSVRSIDVGDGWTNDLAAVRAAVPPQITETFGEPYELRFVDGAGDVVWSVPDFHSVPREGFHMAVADSVVVALRCVGWTVENQCGWVGETPPVEELVGYDKETGAELWVGEPGAVSILAGDVGIVAGDSGYRQIDLATGEPIASAAVVAEQWPSGAFANECCGAGDYIYAKRSGGIVIAVDLSHIRVWFPPELTGQTVSVPVLE